MKKILLAGLMLFAVDAHATAKLDIMPFVERLQGSYVYNQHGDHMAGAHFSLYEYPKDKPWVSANAGVIWNAGGEKSGVGGGFASFSFKVDKVGAYLWKKTTLDRKVKQNFKFPKIDVGPFGGYVQRLGWLYGLHIAKGWG